MFNIERWEEIFQAMGKNKLRTFLTGVSVASGIFILVILLGVGQGLQNGIQKQFEGDATNIVEVWSGVTTKEYKGLNPGRQIQFRNSDYDLSVQKFGHQIDKKSSTYSVWGATAVYGKETGSYLLRGAFPDYIDIENATIIQGRFFNANDIANFEKVAAIGQKVKQDLFKDKNPIGQLIVVNNINYKVVGVFTDPSGEREESRIYVPISTIQKINGTGDKIHYVSYTIKKKDTYEEALAESKEFTKGVGEMLRSKNSIAPDDLSAIGINNSLENAKQFYDLTFYIKAFFWWVGICTIIAGVVGVSNIMLIIVKERTKEIGVRKALGAPPISIIGMILHEAIFITMISGFTGLLLGLILLEIVGPMVDSDFFLNPEVNFSVALTTLFLLVLAGAIAGFFPAYRAAKIKPIIALRHE